MGPCIFIHCSRIVGAGDKGVIPHLKSAGRKLCFYSLPTFLTTILEEAEFLGWKQKNIYFVQLSKGIRVSYEIKVPLFFCLTVLEAPLHTS